MSIGNEQHTNDIFKQKFEDFNIEPSPQVWSNIKDSIAREKRNKIIIISTVSIAASLLLLLLPQVFSLWLLLLCLLLFNSKNFSYNQFFPSGV